MNDKTLISWIAYSHDFNKDRTFNFNGPNASIHRFNDEYSKHYWLMSWREGDIVNRQREDSLKKYIKTAGLGNLVELIFIEINNPIDIIEVREKLEKELIKLNISDCDIFISTGTPTMTVVWYFLKASQQYNLNLFQVSRPKEEGFSSAPNKEFIDFENSVLPHFMYKKVVGSNNFRDDNILITKTIKPIYKRAEQIAMTDNIPVLIYGENGTGKEDLARYIHESSSRNKNKFLTVNCSSLSDQLLESRLFGFAKGAFTGAHEDRVGLFEAANNGTVFLDEIGDISPFMQQSLLRVLQEKEIMRVGENKSRKIDVRVICATNKNLLEMIRAGTYREDLYYRIAVGEIELPSLLERGKNEIQEYINRLIIVNKPIGRNTFALSEETRELLLDYHFPGNLRELHNLILNLYSLQKDIIEVKDLPKRVMESYNKFSWEMSAMEKQHIIKAMQHFKGNKTDVYKALGWGSKNTLLKKIKEYGIRWVNERI